MEVTSPRYILLSGTGSGDSLADISRGLARGGISAPRVVDWENLLCLMLDPDETIWHLEGLWCMVFVSFEDWDHFADYLRDPSIEPSYALVERKTQDLADCLCTTARRSTCRFCVCVMPWSDAAVRCKEVNDFFESVALRLEDSLRELEMVTVARQWGRQDVVRELQPLASSAAYDFGFSLERSNTGD